MARGLARVPGAKLILLAVIGAALAPKPIAVISADGALTGRSSGGFLRSAGNPEKFELQRLSQSIGAAPDAQAKTLSETGLQIPGGRMVKLNGDIYLSLADPKTTLHHECKPKAAIALIAHRGKLALCAQMLLLDKQQLKHSGGLSLYVFKDELRIETVRERRGERPWTITPR